ncbi:MAG: outer membrane beta-barrel protein [Bacteroidaceae bacterium]|nr:outer membrane beta-barrel protein [Bacteroidaceae bacterium]
MKQRWFLTCLFVWAGVLIWAQKNDTDTTKTAVRGMQVYMEVKDHLTHDPVKDVKAQLLWAADSSFADTVHWEYRDEDFYKNSSVDFPVTKAGNYLLKVDAEGYVTKYVPVEVKKLYKRENYRYMKPVYLRTIPKKLDRELDEVVVVATKLKFYMNGDTLVYDADAFNMAEGSMLNELIRKLPGVEMEKGGVIKVNGKQVDALLLNGKNFFDSDRELLLENMPSYMVKHIQSFERVPEHIKGTPQEKNAKKELVMNVKLKKEYQTGWIANAEGGAGATFFRNAQGRLDTKFLGRLFGLRFSDNSRITLFANVNNVNEKDEPGYEGEWGNLRQSGGLTTTYSVGGNYMHDKEDKYAYQASVHGSYTDTDNASNTSNATFLEGGDTYGRSFQNSRNYSWDFRTDHDLRLEHHEPLWETIRYVFWVFRPNFSYNKWNNRGNNASVTLSEDVASQLGKAWMDSIMAPNAGDLLRRYAINRTMTTSKGRGHRANADFEGFLSCLPAHNDYVNITLSYGYHFSDNQTDNFEHYLLDYPNANSNLNAQSGTDFRNRYNPTKDRSQSAHVSTGFGVCLDKEQRHRVELGYDFQYSHNNTNQSLYLLNKLSEWNTPMNQEGVHPLGTLPSVDEMLTTLDAENSSHSKTTTHSHHPQLGYSYSADKNDYYTNISLQFDAPITHETLDYLRGTQVDTLMSRNTFLFNPSINFSRDNYKRNQGFNMNYSMSTSAPSMTSLLNIRDDSNPLYITLGNPHLKKTRHHNFSTSYRDKWHKIFFNSSLGVNITENAVASGYIYNKETGVRTVTPDNVNGNWNIMTNASISVALDKDDKWRVSQRVGYTHNNSVDLSGTNESLFATKSVVKSDNVNENLALRWQPSSKMDFTIDGSLNYQHSGSEREGFITLNVFTFHYGLSAKLELPWNIQFSSDITMYSRRGYSEPSMNTNELVWNARLAKRLMKGKLTIMFDGFDLLGNLSNVQRTVNAQGRTETFRNVIPSYGIIHAIYRLNKQPKKKS